MKRPGYREAIRWIVYNDDTEWVRADEDEGDPMISVTAALVIDLFDVSEERFMADLRRELRKAGRR